jgi:hypothetical protein
MPGNFRDCFFCGRLVLEFPLYDQDLPPYWLTRDGTFWAAPHFLSVAHGACVLRSPLLPEWKVEQLKAMSHSGSRVHFIESHQVHAWVQPRLARVCFLLPNGLEGTLFEEDFRSAILDHNTAFFSFCREFDVGLVKPMLDLMPWDGQPPPQFRTLLSALSHDESTYHDELFYRSGKVHVALDPKAVPPILAKHFRVSFSYQAAMPLSLFSQLSRLVRA